LRTWKIIVFGTILRAAFIATIAIAASNGFELNKTVADHATSSRHQQTLVVDLVSPAEKIDLGEMPNTEPWGPFRTTDW
jgi:hypothetical protein